MVDSRTLAESIERLAALGRWEDLASTLTVSDRAEAEYQRVQQSIEHALVKEAA